MFIILDTTDRDLEARVYDAVNDDDRFITDFSETPDAGDTYVPGSSTHVLEVSEQVEYHDVARARWISLRLAAKGVRLYSNKWNKNDPIYAGKLPTTDDEIRRVIIDARYAEGRAEYFQSFGVNYIGRTNLTPRSIFILDNKKGDPTHSPVENQVLADLYTSMPDDWWGSTSLVSSGNLNKLKTFMDELEETVPITFSSAGAAKLRTIGQEFSEVGQPKPTIEYGITLRQAVTKFSWIY